MTSSSDAPSARLAALGLALPAALAPVGSYKAARLHEGLAYVSGQLPMGPDGLVKGRVGETVSVDEGAAAARLCALNLLAQAASLVGGDIDGLGGCLKLTGFVASGPSFEAHPKVLNGASDLMVAVFGDAGAHVRAAVGVSSLPLGAAVEVEGVFLLADRRS